MAYVAFIGAFLFMAPTTARTMNGDMRAAGKQGGWAALAGIYCFILAIAEFGGAFSALGDVPAAQSLFPNFAPGANCGFHWWYDHMGICLTPLVTNGLSLVYESLRWTFAPSELSTLISEAPVAKKDPPGNFEEMWQRIRDCEMISEVEASKLYAEVITLLKEGKVKWQDAESLARCIYNGQRHTVEMEASAAKEAPLLPDTREDSGF